jgi:hypothetical protein
MIFLLQGTWVILNTVIFLKISWIRLNTSNAQLNFQKYIHIYRVAKYIHASVDHSRTEISEHIYSPAAVIDRPTRPTSCHICVGELECYMNTKTRLLDVFLIPCNRLIQHLIQHLRNQQTINQSALYDVPPTCFGLNMAREVSNKGILRDLPWYKHLLTTQG